MAFESLAEKLQAAFKKLTGGGKVSAADVKAAMRTVKLALLEADVNYAVVKDFIAKVSEKPWARKYWKACPQVSIS